MMMMMMMVVRKDRLPAEVSQAPLHGNVLTPHNIPEFFLPPRLSRRPLPSTDGAAATPRLPPGMAGRYESPHTRRKESLFHQNPPAAATPSSADSAHQAGHPTAHLAPPLQFPLQLLHCEERVHRQHVLPLPHGGRVRLATECINPTPGSSPLLALRVRVVSVEGLRHSHDLRPLNCGLTLCLTPGNLQRQYSATIRHCRNPIFNEDFFFTQPPGGDLRHMELRVKVLEKTGGLCRPCVVGTISRPLSQLLPL
ncbi:C2 calcium-dependent domain-containing protein 4D-like isoform X2 [Denticeps clupeoides]|uniref:C2 calcium-dependent domain-containing protein 4D-like isoform X2 n=1 Tax=Denticeps clupeoides TaxID=299321 RepID=UPI0010A3B85D|nr:C2 calcium-dependent domain-containing protein 4D-like isoform X2 [Denticeps clupeoides]